MYREIVKEGTPGLEPHSGGDSEYHQKEVHRAGSKSFGVVHALIKFLSSSFQATYGRRIILSSEWEHLQMASVQMTRLGLQPFVIHKFQIEMGSFSRNFHIFFDYGTDMSVSYNTNRFV